MTRLAFVTGAGGGIGGAIVARLRGEGWTVVGIDRAGQCEIVHDLSRIDTLPALGERLVREHGAPYLLVLCAGIAPVGRFLDDAPGVWRALLDINLLSPIALTHALLPAMIARGSGVIIGIGSESARVGAAGEAVYSASKGGLAAFLRSLAQEVGGDGVTVNIVSPGPVATGMTAERQALLGKLARRTPLGRVAEAEDVAGAVAWLAGPDGRFMTGQTLSVSGGLVMVP